MKYKSLFMLLFFVLLLGCMSKTENIAQVNLEVRDLAVNLNTVWELTWGPDNFIWMTERGGRVSRVNPESGEVISLITIEDVYENGESGLMGMALDPDFDDNPFVYLAYNYRESGNTLVKIVKYNYNGTTLVDPVILVGGIPGNVIHDGCRLKFFEGKLYITTGDAGNAPNAQNLSSINGKILRINPDGSIPSDNPIPDSRVWAWGHRNPQGMTFANGILYISDHGPNSDDEVNIVQKGRNYGWEPVRGYCDTQEEEEFCQDSNVVEPIAAWTPTLAVCGLEYYDNDKIPQWKNSLLMVTLKASRLVQLKLSDDHMTVVSQTEFYSGTYGRLRAICVAPDGRVFIGTSNRDGRGTVRQNDDRIIEITGRPTSTGEKQDKGADLLGYPNPADGSIRFSYEGVATTQAVIEIFNAFGTSIRKLILSGNSINWDCRNDLNQRCSPGYYYAILEAGHITKDFGFIIK